MQLNLGMYITDRKSEFSILVDRATGGSSLHDGEIEVMLHRYVGSISKFIFTINFHFEFSGVILILHSTHI